MKQVKLWSAIIFATILILLGVYLLAKPFIALILIGLGLMSLWEAYRILKKIWKFF